MNWPPKGRFLNLKFWSFACIASGIFLFSLTLTAATLNSSGECETQVTNSPSTPTNHFEFLNLVGVALNVATESDSETLTRWAPYFAQLWASGNYQSEKKLMSFLKDWDPEIAAVVENSILGKGFRLYKYTHSCDLAEANPSSDQGANLLVNYDPNFKDWHAPTANFQTHAFLWYSGLPRGWRQALSYYPLRQGVFGQCLYEIEVTTRIRRSSSYTVGDAQEFRPHRTTAEIVKGNRSSGNGTRIRLDSFYEEMGLLPSGDQDRGVNQEFANFNLSDRRGLLLLLFLQLELVSRTKGYATGLAPGGTIYQPHNSWIDVKIGTKVRVPKDATFRGFLKLPPNAVDELGWN